MKVLLINNSDHHSKYYRIEFNINIGSINDEKYFPGFNYLLFNILFKGSKKYKDSDSILKTIKKNKGID